jgi:aspartate aminotransferase-like enzyme
LNWPISDLNKFLQQRGMRIANGYGKLKEITFRIAHMAELTMDDVNKLISYLEEWIAQQPK